MKTLKNNHGTSECHKEKNQNLSETAPSIRPSLFSSICASEGQSAIDAEIAKHANRVGFTLKVLYGRELSTIRNSFIEKLSLLVQDTCNAIDDELHSAEKTS